MKQIYTLDAQNYQPVSTGNKYVYLQYDAIQSFLSQNFRETVANVLTKPIKEKDTVNFYSSVIGQFKSVDEFNEEERHECLVQYNALLREVHNRCAEFELSTDSDKYHWSQILRIVFDSDSNVLLYNGKELLIVWGWKFSVGENYILPYAQFASVVYRGDEPIEFLPREPVIEDEVEEIDVLPEESEIESMNIEEEVPKEVIVPPIVVPEPVIEEKPPIQARTPRTPPVKKKKPMFFAFLDGVENTFKKYWWIFLILLIVILLLLFLGRCDSKPVLAADMPPTEQERVYREIMPEQPRHRTIPIDTTKFIHDEDSYGKVLSNVVNIALKNKKDNFKHLAIDLKNAFPEKEYEIIYFDDETMRLQFKFPDEERKKIKNSIRKKLDGYDLLIWDEAIFERVKRMNDPVFSNRNKRWHLDVVNAEKAWDITTGDTSIVIAIIDDGFDLDHDELKGKIVNPYNVVTDSKVLTSGPKRMHGTHVAGIALANANNGIGICGIAPDCRLMPIQASGGAGHFTMTDIIDGILYAIKNDADVINMSLGKEFSKALKSLDPRELKAIADRTGLDEANFWNELFTMAEENNVTIVLAGGNQSLLVGLDPMQRSEAVIKVAATDSHGGKAWFSNYFIDAETKESYISAPGLEIYSSVPGDKYKNMSGTSMAAPIVTGCIALMKSIDPTISNKEIMRILHETGLEVTDPKLAPIIQIDKALGAIKKK